MTTIVYETPVELVTNGDCSSIQIRFPVDPELLEMVTELRQSIVDTGGFGVMKPRPLNNPRDDYTISLVSPLSMVSFGEMGLLVEKSQEKPNE